MDPSPVTGEIEQEYCFGIHTVDMSLLIGHERVDPRRVENLGLRSRGTVS